MTAPELVGAIVAAATPTCGAVFAIVKWNAAAKEKQEDAKRKHDQWVLGQFREMQAAFMDAIRERDDLLARHRLEHLADTRKYAQDLADLTAAVRHKTLPPAG